MKKMSTETTVGPGDGHARSKKMVEMSALAKLHHSKRSPECLLKNSMLTVK